MENRMSANGGSQPKADPLSASGMKPLAGATISGGKICLINNLYKPLARGGAETVAETITQGLLAAGHKVFIITTKPYGRKSQIPASPAGGPNPCLAGRRAKSQIYYLDSLYYNLNSLPKFLRLFWHIWNMFNFVNYFKIKKILRAEKCDAVITNNLMGLGYLTSLAIKKLKIKQLHLVHDIQLIHPSGLMFYGRENVVNSCFARNYAGLCSRLFASPNVVIFPSKWLRDIHLEKIFFIKSKRIILPNPLPAPLSSGGNLPWACRTSRLDQEEKASRGGAGFKFLFLGQIEKHKGVFLLIDAFKKIKEKYPEVELLLAGDGSQTEPARRQAAGNKNIKFLGWPGDEQADKLLLSNNCLVYPSLVYENCPNAIQRALAAGLPVLAANLGGIPELLNHNAGILFKPAEIDDLVDKMAWVINNRNNLENIVKAGKEKAALGSVNNYVKELERLII